VGEGRGRRRLNSEVGIRNGEDREQMKEGERLGRWEGEIKPGQRTEDGGRRTEGGGRKTEAFEWGSGNGEVGKKARGEKCKA